MDRRTSLHSTIGDMIENKVETPVIRYFHIHFHQNTTLHFEAVEKYYKSLGYVVSIKHYKLNKIIIRMGKTWHDYYTLVRIVDSMVDELEHNETSHAIHRLDHAFKYESKLKYIFRPHYKISLNYRNIIVEKI